MHVTSARSRTWRAIVAAALVISPLAAVMSVATPAQAATNDQSMSGVTSSMWQTNSDVNALAVAGGVVYAGGKFTAVRPPGTSTGSSSEVSRTYLAAFSASTGALITTFNYTLNGQVNDLAVSPDGSTLYVAGTFSTVNGSSRGRVAAISLTSNTLLSWNPNANKGVTAVAATASRVYLSGDFTTVKSTSKAYIAAVYSPTATDGTSGSLVSAFQATLTAPPPSMFTTAPSAHALTMLVSPDGSRLLVGGGFLQADGTTTGGMASLSPVDGSLQDWAANTSQPINTNCSGRVTAIVSDGTSAYVTAEGDPPGCYEGTYRADLGTGQLIWDSTCLGAGQGLAVVNGVLYKGSHQHDCAFNAGGAYGGFVGGTSRINFIHRHLTGQSTTDGRFLHWSPDTNSSGTTAVGPHVLGTDGSQVFVGGDFTTVNDSAQQGLARFSPNGNQATPKVPGKNIQSDNFDGLAGAPGANLPVTVQPTKAGTLTVEIPAVEDADNGTLTYQIYRDGGTTAIASLTAESYPWSRPVLRYDDTGLVAGSSHSYRVSASDGIHTSAKSTAVSGTVAASAPATFASVTSALNPLLWWRLDDSGATAADSSGQGETGSFQGGVSTGAPGAIGADAAVTLDGSSGYVTSDATIAAPGAFSESAWFKTSTTSGGVILAQTDTQTGAGGNTDRMITMDNNGGLVFALKGSAVSTGFGPSTLNLRNQGPIWNDGKWHQVVGTYDGNGTLALYVDGQLQMSRQGSLDDSTLTAAGMPTSYLRAGYADLSQIQVVFGVNFYNQKWPASEFFNGSLDEPAAWGYALSGSQVQSLFASGVADPTQAPNNPPAAAFTTTVNAATVGVDASTSSDSDGTIAGYSWNWGDGTTSGTGQTTTHTYTTAGTETITLTVTDDDGATATTTHDVTVTPAQPVTSTVVANGSTWSWLYNGTAPAAGWNGIGGNLSSWNTGAATLGFPATGVSTNIDTFASTSSRPLTAYFVKSFTVPDASKVTQLTLTGLANDGVVVYVNGTEVTRSNMPTGTITAQTYASSARTSATAASAPFTVNVPTSLLVTGTNVVAAETHLNYKGTKDASFDLKADLTATP